MGLIVTDIRESATPHEHLINDGSMINDGVTIEGLRDYVKSQAEIAYTMRWKALKEEATRSSGSKADWTRSCRSWTS